MSDTRFELAACPFWMVAACTVSTSARQPTGMRPGYHPARRPRGRRRPATTTPVSPAVPQRPGGHATCGTRTATLPEHGRSPRAARRCCRPTTARSPRSCASRMDGSGAQTRAGGGAIPRRRDRPPCWQTRPATAVPGYSATWPEFCVLKNDVRPSDRRRVGSSWSVRSLTSGGRWWRSSARSIRLCCCGVGRPGLRCRRRSGMVRRSLGRVRVRGVCGRSGRRER